MNTDFRPRCCECGERWTQPDGVDAQVVPCTTCRGKVQLAVVPGVEEASAPSIEVGQWYWVTTQNERHLKDEDECFEDDEDEDIGDDDIENDEDDIDNADNGRSWFACVVAIGSNFVEVQSPGGWDERIHVDEFETRCRYEPDSKDIIDREVAVSQAKVQELMREVQAITARLGVQEALSEGGETQALALLGDADYGGYQTALEKAKSEDLPALFKAIKKANERLTKWLTAVVIPLKAEFGLQREIIEKIEDKIFHVQIYAGLVEDIVTVADGKPASSDEKLCIYQRKFFMDEECLLDYQAGGMEFKDIRAFDRWLKKKKNRDRILPFPRCIVSFQVRRRDKDRGVPTSLGDFIQMRELEKLDKGTLLYIRNGQQLYRLHTEIEFGETLFPDLDRTRFEGKLWVHTSYHRSHHSTGYDGEGIIDQNAHEVMGEEYRAKLKQYRYNKKTVKKDKEYGKDVKRAGKAYAMQWLLERKKMRPYEGPNDERKRYVPFDQTNLYYDDAIRKLARKAAEFNRIALVLQGLFDRSPILHPHPKVSLWTPQGMDEAIKLLFDADRALHQGEKPDFKAYRAKLNESLDVGCFTIGQERAWLNKVQAKEHERRCNNWRYNSRDHDVASWWSPYGDDGPGMIAQVVSFKARSKRCVYEWERQRQTFDQWKEQSKTIRTTITVDAKKLLNVSAYRPGDFLQFFQDPRTREEYLKWAPLLLRAEDWHAKQAAEKKSSKKKRSKKA